MKRLLTLSGIALFSLLLIGAVVVGPPSSSGGGGAGSSGPTTNAPTYAEVISGTNFVVDFLALGATNSIKLTLTAHSGIQFTNVIKGMKVTMEVWQDSSGTWSLVTNGIPNYRISADIPWTTPTTNATKCDTWALYCAGTNVQVVGVTTGFSP